ncbi:MAG: hypothetical protein ACK4E3_03540 [Brevundimonas sp.]|uniref:hypothetical protein n=1 Tax=Brevundimonas sp. TaxID=1871086 RepID=UPI00391C0EF9
MSTVAFIRRLLDAGFTHDQALIAAEAFEACAPEPAPQRSKAAERQARYRARKTAESGSDDVHGVTSQRNKTSRVTLCDAPSPSLEVSPQTPLPKPIPTLPPSPPKGGSSPTGEDAEPDEPPPAKPKNVDEAETVARFWNDIAAANGLATVSKLTEDRRRKIRARLREHGLEGLQAAIRAVPRSRFLVGENDRSWRAGFDFVLRPESCAKLIEGGYGDDRRPAVSQADPPAPVDWGKRLSLWQSERYWPEQVYGPPPGQPGCRMPPEIMQGVQ